MKKIIIILLSILLTSCRQDICLSERSYQDKMPLLHGFFSGTSQTEAEKIMSSLGMKIIKKTNPNCKTKPISEVLGRATDGEIEINLVFFGGQLISVEENRKIQYPPIHETEINTEKETKFTYEKVHQENQQYSRILYDKRRHDRMLNWMKENSYLL